MNLQTAVCENEEQLQRKIQKREFCRRKREPGQIKKDIVAGQGIYIYVGK